ncbi:MAG: 2-oxoglutarate dehydrogenase E1 component, partial [Gammaproteobacteria bacterium]
HIIVNNQIGFTTSDPLDARSTLYCTEVAKMVQAPIIHVNGDDPEAVVFATRIALDFRKEFHKDVVIDLVCYRRHGHNEADEPSATQPTMYKLIKARETAVSIYGKKLVGEGVIAESEPDNVRSNYRDALDNGKVVATGVVEGKPNEFAVNWHPYLGIDWREPANTAMSVERVQDLSHKLLTLPDGFVLHPRVQKIMDARGRMAAGALPLDWGFAETMAYAGILEEGHQVRLSGQDCERGTFFHRHSVLHNMKDGDEFTPLKALTNNKPSFTVINSLLSEEAVLGFEYGYATAEPEALVIWEAQFGDFANGAQVVIDQFITSGRAKWGRLCGLVMLLPHGQEGQGPEHSSARLERYLQLCAEHNVQVCVPTTPAQVFHMLRRQALRPYRHPLIVMTPKSLLRHKLATSSLEDLADGTFQTVIDEIDDLKHTKIDRIVLCSGKVYYDLLEARRERELENVALIRIEQLYPFPKVELPEILAKYPHAKDVVWCQEEPMNQGAWFQIQHKLRAAKRPRQSLRYAGRPSMAAPAPGYMALHLEQLKQFVEDALL